ncbi:MAG: enoyl-CoA hydratase/isomerase family protein, partial [Bdellovibrionales bacterium]|nr:enoyl-CoA hydratase/isomerase family protein [Bdellovibrionales bacterium]
LLTGEGEKAFVAGADIKEMKNLTPDQGAALSERGQRLFSQIEDFPCPVVAAVNGFALGGGMELALSCDFIIARNNARFGLPEVSLGLIPGYGGTQRLQRNLGRGWAKRMVLTGEMISAEQALQIGFVTEVLDEASFWPKLLGMAQLIAARGPKAVEFAKAAVNESDGLPLREGLRVEAKKFGECFGTSDQQEGIAAFIEKRKPDFQGR